MNSHIIFRRQEDFTFVSIRFTGSSHRTVYDMTYRNCPVFWEINLDFFSYIVTTRPIGGGGKRKRCNELRIK
jgi:hypothetical protein